MIDNRKTMDFFRPVRSTDPLVSRPTAPPQPTVIRREKVTSLPPALKESPNAKKERDVYNASKPPVYSSSVVVEEAIIERETFKKPERKPDTTKEEKKSFFSKKHEDAYDDDWFTSLKAEGFLKDFEPEPEEKQVKLEKKLKEKPLYTFTGESPFLKSVKVEKRPLSNSAPKKKQFNPDPVYTPKKTEKKPEKFLDNQKLKETNGVPFPVIVVLTIILGVAAGIAVFILIS